MQKAYKNRVKFNRRAALGSELQKSAPSRGRWTEGLSHRKSGSTFHCDVEWWSQERSGEAASPGFYSWSLWCKYQGITLVVFLFRPKVGGGISLMVFLVIHISLPHAVLLPNWKVTKLKIFTNWNVVDLQCCVSLRYIAKWFSYIIFYIYIYFFFILFSIIYYYKELNIVPYDLHSRSLAIIYYTYNSVHPWIPNSNLSLPSPHFPLW